MLHPRTITPNRWFMLALALAGLMAALLALFALRSAQPLTRAEPPALPGSDQLERAASASAARYEGLAQEYAAQRARDAETARWMGLARRVYIPPVQNADAARWTGLAQAHLAAMKDAQAANAYAARYEALAQTFAQPTGYEPQRALNAYAARWSGLAQMLATAEP